MSIKFFGPTETEIANTKLDMFIEGRGHLFGLVAEVSTGGFVAKVGNIVAGGRTDVVVFRFWSESKVECLRFRTDWVEGEVFGTNGEWLTRSEWNWQVVE